MQAGVLWAVLLMVGLVWSHAGFAQRPDDGEDVTPAAIPETPVEFITSHRGRFGGSTVRYRARAGETFLRDDEGTAQAAIFTIAYTRDDVDDARRRPVTFVFNGGPGSASLWLHMGALGPRRVVVPSDARDDGAPPYPIHDNLESVLDITDLVFIDPVGTGYSRVLGEADPKDFWGVSEDAKSVARFIEAWLGDNKRWNAPKYVAGESYGTVRAALLAEELNKRSIALNGIVLISAVLHYQNSRISDGAIMSYVSFLPTYAATAWYHDQLPDKPADLEAFLDEVRDFARTDYATALIAGTRLGDSARDRIIDRLVRYTGLERDYLDQADMRPDVFRFMKELMRDERRVVGRLDSRYLGVEPDVVAERFEADPAAAGISSAYVAAVNSHLSETLAVEMDRPYQARGRDVFPNWNWVVGEKAPNGGRYINVVPALGRAMHQNADLRILVMSGYFDFATPFFGAENALAEPFVVPERITYTYYEAGHMMYLHEPSRQKMLADMRRFITREE